MDNFGLKDQIKKKKDNFTKELKEKTTKRMSTKFKKNYFFIYEDEI